MQLHTSCKIMDFFNTRVALFLFCIWSSQGHHSMHVFSATIILLQIVQIVLYTIHLSRFVRLYRNSSFHFIKSGLRRMIESKKIIASYTKNN
jgi:hypothetical protein